jgi:hypothetical protein
MNDNGSDNRGSFPGRRNESSSRHHIQMNSAEDLSLRRGLRPERHPPKFHLHCQLFCNLVVRTTGSYCRSRWSSGYRVFHTVPCHMTYLFLLFMFMAWDYVSERRSLSSFCSPPRLYKSIGSHGGIILTGENQITRINLVPVPLCPSQIPHLLIRAQTRASALRRRRITAWNMARQYGILTIKLQSIKWLIPLPIMHRIYFTSFNFLIVHYRRNITSSILVHRKILNIKRSLLLHEISEARKREAWNGCWAYPYIPYM